MSRDGTLSRIRQYLRLFDEIVSGAWVDYHGPKYRQVALDHSRISRPNLIRDHMVARARKIAMEEQEFSLVDKSNGFFGLTLGESFLFQFNKLNDGLYKRIGSSNQYELFVTQSPIDETPLMALHLIVGYVPNQFWTAFDGPFIVCPNGRKSYAWYIDIAEELRTPTIVLPQAAPSAPPLRRSRVRSKEERTKDRKQSDGSDS
jgi:hypothetical protein